VKVASSLFSLMDDWLNPLSVREFRQAVRSRWVMIVVVLLLLINIVCIGGYLILEPNAATSSNGGASVYGVLFSVLMFVTIGFVPCYTGIRLLLEHNDLNTDLLFGTTLSPSAIVRGKYLSAMALSLLLMSACMPFMTMTYLLRGVDLISIFLSMCLLLAVSALANAIGILVGSIPASWFIRALIGGLALVGLGGLMYFTSLLTFQMLMFGGGIEFKSPLTLILVGGELLIEVMLIGLLLSYAIVFLSPRTSNRMFPLRLYVTAIWLISGVLAIGTIYLAASWIPGPRRLDPDIVFAWGVIWTSATIVLMVASLGERDSWTFRVRRTIPRLNFLRFLAFLTYSGSAGGFMWSCLLALATLLTLYSWIDWGMTGFSTKEVELFVNLAITVGFIYCYCITAVLLRMTFLRNARTILLPLVALIIGLSVAVVPYMVVFFMSNTMRDPSPMTLMASPLGLSIPSMRDDVISWATPLLIVWAPTSFFLSLPWFFKQWRQFVRHETSGMGHQEFTRTSTASISQTDSAQPSAIGAESPTI